MTTSTDVAEFRVDGPLPGPGRLVLEASAGTGKTFALSALATRLIADGLVDVEELLVVTFTRAASAELRDRVRRRLVEAARFLAGPAPGHGVLIGDPVHRVLADGDDQIVGERRRRLDRAVVDFDTACITTIHGFCTQVLSSLGSASGHNPDAVLVQDTKELIRGVCADTLTTVSLHGPPPAFRTKLSDWVTCVLNNPGVQVVARSNKTQDQEAAERVRIAADLVRRRLVLTGGISYDGLLETVRDVLVAAPEAAVRLARQFPVALIDEFQDTDPVQWDIFRTIYTELDGAHRTDTRLVLVGDPKQAIYSFRGGDIHTYLAAARDAPRMMLATNRRSDGAVLAAMNALCDGWVLGAEGITYQPVRSSPEHADRRLVDGEGVPLPAVDVRCIVDPSLPRNSRGMETDAARRACIDDLVQRISGLLDGRARVGDDVLAAGDIAVLIHANRWGPPIQRALHRAGIPSVITGGSSVADSQAADQWRVLIDALVRPADPTRARAVALSWFQDWDAVHVADTADVGLDDLRLARLQAQLEHWARVLRTQGVSALIATLRSDAAVGARVLAQPNGERNLTDLDHLGELLHAATAGRPVGPESLRVLLDGLRGGDEDDPEAIRRRIETDASAVRIMTLHASKGLEFPVVCCPSLWNVGSKVSQRLFHDGEQGRLLDVSLKATDVKAEHEAATRDVRGQNGRLTYVGLTRARHQSIVWWTPAGGASRNPVASVLFGTDAIVPGDEGVHVDTIRQRLAGTGLGDEVRVSAVDPARDLRRTPPTPAAPTPAAPTPAAPVPAPVPGAEPTALVVAELGRSIDRRSGRWSFTAITGHAAAHDAGPTEPGSAPGVPAGTDPDDPTLGDASDGDEQDPPPPVLFDGLGAGAAFGTLVHEALEHLDFTGDIEADLTAHLSVRPWATADPGRLPALVTAVAAAVRTPMGDAFHGARLDGLARSDRLDELDFELPLGSVAPGARRTVSSRWIGRILVESLGRDDPVGPWAHRLADGIIDVDLGGYLTGSVDLVMRLAAPGVAGGQRFSVVDYKTNRLGSWGVPDELANYHPDRLAVAMADHHYPLQAVLYSVALHRYLRWRLPGYDPPAHLGPVGYLFVRGMVGPRTPSPQGRTHGVFVWHPPADAVVALSDLLHGTVQ